MTSAQTEPEQKLAAPSPYAALLRIQRADGSWVGEVELNPGPTAQAIILWNAIGLTFPLPLAGKAKKYILRSQNSDGGWSPHGEAPSEVSLTIECYVALRLMGESVDDGVCAQARKFILDNGGVAAANPWTQLYLGVIGVIPWAKVQKVPLEVAMLPRAVPFSLKNFAYWVKVISLPMSLLGAVGPGPAVAAATDIADELKIASADFTGLAKSRFAKILSALATKVSQVRWPYLRARMIANALQCIDEFTESHGDFGGNTCTALNVLLVLDRIGERDSDKFRRGLDALMSYAVETDDEWRLQCCQSHVWDTGFALSALGPGDRTTVDAAKRGVKWLKARQILTESGDWANNVKAQPGGWCFGDRHEHFPVTDCTALALVAIIRHDPVFRDSPEAMRARTWLCEMQHESGGWSAYEKFVGMGSLDRFFKFKDIPNGMLDVPKADVTAKVVQALIPWRSDPDVQAVLDRARTFLFSKREANGLWRGNYGVNYIYGTWLAARALAQLDGDPQAEWARTVRTFFIDHQNRDGGWGECEASYRDPNLAGRGRSSVVQTSWALLGLCAVSDGSLSIVRAVNRGRDYLLQNRAADTSWADAGFWGTVFPGMVYFRYSLYPVYFPLMALEAAEQTVLQTVGA